MVFCFIIILVCLLDIRELRKRVLDNDPAITPLRAYNVEGFDYFFDLLEKRFK